MPGGEGGIDVEQGARSAGVVEHPYRRHKTMEMEVLPLSPIAIIFLAQFLAYCRLSIIFYS